MVLCAGIALELQWTWAGWVLFIGTTLTGQPGLKQTSSRVPWVLLTSSALAQLLEPEWARSGSSQALYAGLPWLDGLELEQEQVHTSPPRALYITPVILRPP